MTAHAVQPSGATVADLRRAVLDWYAVERRDFPWRGTGDPYAVLVSEVMLQQTQAARVAPRFERFMRRFPTASALAGSTAPDLLAEWSGLGYNRRALNLRRAAQRVAEGWPRDVTGLEALPGVGRYTARAVASLTFGIPVGVVDTNVRRWLLRAFGCTDAPRPLQALADALAAPGSGADVAAWTHATMELGASVCRPRAPRCEACPIAQWCRSRGKPAAVTRRRQAAFRGSDRAYRGAVLRRLTVAPDGGLAERELRASIGDSVRADPGLDDGRWKRVLSGLERDGLVHRAAGMVALGGDTIGQCP